jgi:hypothetical protein
MLLIKMNKQQIIGTLKRFLNASPLNRPLGRWGIHNYNQTSLKIKYANEDNCGTCCQYENKHNEIKQQNIEDDELYVYMMGIETVPDIKKN